MAVAEDAPRPGPRPCTPNANASGTFDAGYDLCLFVDSAPDDLICSICQQVVSDPHVTEECGHLFCRSCIFRGLQEQARCPLCRGDVHADQVRRDIRAHRQVQRLRVRCSHAAEGCEWTGDLSEMPRHEPTCAHRPIACPYAGHGCTVVLARTGLYEHEQSHVQAHLSLVNDALGATRRRCEELEQQQPLMLHTLGTLREEIKALRQQQRQRDTEAASARAALDHELHTLRQEMHQLRIHCGRGGASVRRRSLVSSAQQWDTAHTAGKFEVSQDGRRARHLAPGWNSIPCTSGVSRGQHMWHLRIDSLPEKSGPFIPSTVMVGITTATSISATHLGNVRGAWCYQDNGYKWDGSECFSYGDGQTCVPGDVVTVAVDLDEGTLEFRKNGASLGVAFDDVGGLVYPAVSLCTDGHSVTLIADPSPQGAAARVPRSGATTPDPHAAAAAAPAAAGAAAAPSAP